MSITKQLAALKRSAGKKHKAATETIGTASVGDVIRQGDLYLVCLDAAPKGTAAKSRQLAPGATQGSRHVAEGDCVVCDPASRAAVAKVINAAVRGAAVPEELIGPFVHVGSEATITHPEHGHKVLPRDSVWAVVFQRAFAEEVRRVQD